MPTPRLYSAACETSAASSSPHSRRPGRVPRPSLSLVPDAGSRRQGWRTDRTRAGAYPRRATVLPDDACPTCGTMMVERRAALTLPVNGEPIRVPDCSHLRCPKCGEILLRLDEARALDRGAFDRYRTKYSLLSSTEIRAIRHRTGAKHRAHRSRTHEPPALTGRGFVVAGGNDPTVFRPGR
jgi:YgiT-type zinc finger domain-containing protein